MKNQDIIFTGLQSWDIPIGSNAKNIAQTMSLQNRVLYVNPPASMADKDAKTPRRLRRINDNLYVLDLGVKTIPINTIPFDMIFDRLNRYNNTIITNSINEAVRELEFHNFVHINDNDIFRGFYLKELLKPILSVYYRRDWLLGVDYWRKHGTVLEPKLMAKSDLVLANSPYLADTAREFNPESYYVGQGVDLTMYDPNIEYDCPQELQSLDAPIVGYTGVISSLRLDPDLIYNTAAILPEVSFVMVGAEDEKFQKHKLHTIENVIFTGAKKPEELPAYIAKFNICINPQAINDITKANYPRKIDEYLAMGKPVIATLTPTMKIFEPLVTLCKSAQEYAQNIVNIISQETKEQQHQRIELAQSHSWENSVQQIYSHIEAKLPK